MFVSTELESQVQILEGDVETWTQIIAEYGKLRSRFPGVRIVILGDANIHLQYLVQHDDRCSCLHCVQKATDRKIEADLHRAGLFAFNPPHPTHQSGHIIDLCFAEASHPIDVVVEPSDIGLSDHKLIWADCAIRLQFSFQQSVGRVMWARPGLWEHVFCQALPALEALRNAIEEATEEIFEARSLQVKRRRAILDAAAWARDAIVCLLGHCFSLTVVRGARCTHPGAGHKWPESVPRPEDFDDFDSYKLAMADFNIGIREGVFEKFVSLRNCDPNEAKRFLSACVKSNKGFQVALTDEETGQLLSTQQALQALADDLEARADVSPAQDSFEHCWVREAVRSIKQAKAPAAGLPGLPPLPQETTANNPHLYTSSELEQALSSIQTRKQCIHGPLAAVKASVPEARELTLALVNLARAAEVTATSWCFRRINPLRKSGPRVVRKLRCLRPISLTADMAAVQDALWLARCKRQLDAFTNLRQLGGKMDTILVILAVILHVQIRHYQGVDTYLLFSDIQQAFDTASHDGMLFSVYLAGVVEVEWRLLSDFLAMDTANIMLAGLLSQVLTLRAGIPQGRKFSVQVFTALLKHFGEVLLTECSPSQSLLPDFAADAISGLWAALSPAPNDTLLSGLGEQPSLQQVAAAVAQAPSPTEARRLAIHLLSMQST
ncbi:unnamed protein product [Symbiodinium sp. CCMP2592]|nr:unnamed protein product [Symbiodinium sp. CCMP2592]